MLHRDSPRVLVVATDLRVAHLLARRLDVRHARSVRAAEKARVGSFDGAIAAHDVAGADGFEWLRRVRREHPSLPLALLGADRIGEVLDDAHCIRARVFTTRVSEAALAEFLELVAEHHRDSLGDVHLSPRERACLCGVLAQRTYKEVAAAEGITVSSVRAYHVRALRRLGCASLAEARRKYGRR